MRLSDNIVIFAARGEQKGPQCDIMNIETKIRVSEVADERSKENR